MAVSKREKPSPKKGKKFPESGLKIKQARLEEFLVKNSKDKIDQAIKLFQAGKSGYSISQELNCSYRFVARVKKLFI